MHKKGQPQASIGPQALLFSFRGIENCVETACLHNYPSFWPKIVYMTGFYTYFFAGRPIPIPTTHKKRSQLTFESAPNKKWVKVNSR